MGSFIVYSLLTQKEAQYAYDGIRQWFKDNPERDECVTETFTVSRGHIKEDILANSEKGVTLKEGADNTDFTASLSQNSKTAAPKKTGKKTNKASANKASKKPNKKSTKKSK